jgi:hypothetical protein
MKSVVVEIFLLLAIAPTVMPRPAEAGGMIYTPGQPAKFVSTFVDGYAIYDMGGGGNTYVQHIDSQSTMIRRSGEPTTFIYNNPGTHIEPVLPVGPDLGIEVEGFE